MTLVYRFKKEKLLNGGYVSRPRILVELSGSDDSIIVPALIDSGSDMTVIPEGMARGIGLSMKGKKDKLYAYRESSDVVESSANIIFLGREHRQSVTLFNVPVLVTVLREGTTEENDIVLGVQGIFDAFEITFNKTKNKITLKNIGDKFFYKK